MFRNVPQPSVYDLPGKHWDVVIIGAGPSGATCALVLARAGHSVLLLDKQCFPRHKPCGDVLMPDALTMLSRLGLRERVESTAFAFDTFRVYSPSGHEFTVPGEYRSLKRYDYDALLVAAAVEAGATFALGHPSGVENCDNGATIQFSKGEPSIEAGQAVIATGASVHLSHRLNMVTDRKPAAIALRRYVRAPFPLDEAVLVYDRQLLPAYAWIIPQGNEWFNVGCGIRVNGRASGASNPRKMLKYFETHFPLATRLMKSATRVDPPEAAPLRCGLTGNRDVRVGSILATGETIGTTFPFTGEGIGKAMHSGAIAGEVIAQSFATGDRAMLETYRGRLDNELAPAYEGYTLAEKWLSRPRVNDFMARRVNRSRYLQTEVARFIAETGDPRRLYSPWSILRSLWR